MSEYLQRKQPNAFDQPKHKKGSSGQDTEAILRLLRNNIENPMGPFHSGSSEDMFQEPQGDETQLKENNATIQKQTDPDEEDVEDENTVYGHGVTNSETNLIYDGLLFKNKKKKLPIGQKIGIVEDADADNLSVKVDLSGKIFEGTIPKSDVNITPNSLDEIDPTTMNDIVLETASGSSSGTIAASICYIHYNKNYSAGMQLRINSELDGQVSSSQALSVSNKTVTLSVEFSNLSAWADITPDELTTYENKAVVFRFTRFNNGNTDDVILVEELGVYDKTLTLSEDEIINAKEIFTTYDIDFVVPAADAATADSDLQSNIGTSLDNKYIKELHSKAYLPLTAKEKEAVYTSVLKLPENALEDIRGLRFGKKFCKIKLSGGHYIADFPNAYYNSGVHEVILIKAATISVDNVFGDEGSDDFSERMEFTVLHEIGHAVDFKPYRDGRDALIDPLNEKYDAYEQARVEAKDAIDAYKDFYDKTGGSISPSGVEYQTYLTLNNDKNTKKDTRDKLLLDYQNYKASINGQGYYTSSGSGAEIDWSQADPYVDNVIETDFSKAIDEDKPRITPYSNDNIKEAYAESFALYISEPLSLKSLSPKVYEYFETRYPQ